MGTQSQTTTATVYCSTSTVAANNITAQSRALRSAVNNCESEIGHLAELAKRVESW